MYCESIFLLSCDTQFHIFHQQIAFFHLFYHLSCIITKAFHLVLKPSKGTALNFPSLHLPHRDTQELLLFPYHPSTHQYLLPFAIYIYIFFFATLCFFKHVYQPFLAHPRKGTSPASLVQSVSPDPVPLMLLSGQTFSDSPHSIYPWAICPSLLSCHAFAFLFWELERFHCMFPWIFPWKYHCHLAGQKYLPHCGYCTVLKWNHVYNEDYRLPTSKFSFLQWLLGQISGATFPAAFCNSIRQQVRETKNEERCWQQDYQRRKGQIS